jgi:hypothetical protein
MLGTTEWLYNLWPLERHWAAHSGRLQVWFPKNVLYLRPECCSRYSPCFIYSLYMYIYGHVFWRCSGRGLHWMLDSLDSYTYRALDSTIAQTSSDFRRQALHQSIGNLIQRRKLRFPWTPAIFPCLMPHASCLMPHPVSQLLHFSHTSLQKLPEPSTSSADSQLWSTVVAAGLSYKDTDRTPEKTPLAHFIHIYERDYWSSCIVYGVGYNRAFPLCVTVWLEPLNCCFYLPLSRVEYSPFQFSVF